MSSIKTGSHGRPWVTLEQPKPAPVLDRYEYGSSPPLERSERCTYWLRQIERGWSPNRFVRRQGYDTSAQWYGVYIWEYLNEIMPVLDAPSAPSAGKG